LLILIRRDLKITQFLNVIFIYLITKPFPWLLA